MRSSRTANAAATHEHFVAARIDFAKQLFGRVVDERHARRHRYVRVFAWQALYGHAFGVLSAATLPSHFTANLTKSIECDDFFVGICYAVDVATVAAYATVPFQTFSSVTGFNVNSYGIYECFFEFYATAGCR